MDTYVNDQMDRITQSNEMFIPPSLLFAKRAARRLQHAHYLVTGSPIQLSRAQEALSRIYGHSDWFSLGQSLIRQGSSTSLFDAALDPTQRESRRMGQIDMLRSTLDLSHEDASRLLLHANPTDSQTTTRMSDTAGENSTIVGLPRAMPRQGMHEILFTAHTFSFTSRGVPLPGWQQFALIAAPLDNTAIWARFCDADNIAVAAKMLVHAIKELSGGSLNIAYVPSNVRNQFSHLDRALSELGVRIEGGRPATMAARLSQRLYSALVHVSFGIHKNEALPSIVELSRVFHLDDGLVEIPDAKNLGDARYNDSRAFDFSNQLIDLIREQRLQETEKQQVPAQAANSRPAKQGDDGGITFNSAVRTIPVGLPVYRIRIELPLIDYHGFKEVRRVTISRVIDVPTHYDLWDLHVAIQDAMGWSDYHLHQFTFANPKAVKNALTFSSPNADDPDEPTSANEPLLNHVVSMATHSAEYLYDFGDSWKHQLTLVGTVPSDGGGYPRCVEGEFACPPEDCGSEPGYFRVIDVMSGTGQRHAGEKKQTAEWLKGHPNVDWPYRPNHFDPSNVWFNDPQERWDYAYNS